MASLNKFLYQLKTLTIFVAVCEQKKIDLFLCPMGGGSDVGEKAANPPHFYFYLPNVFSLIFFIPIL